MNRLIYSQIKDDVARVIGKCPDDDDVLMYTNRALERLLYEGKWVGTVCRYAVCITDNCVTLPRHIETVESASLCGRSLTIRDGWYEDLESGPGQWINPNSTNTAGSGVAGQMIPKGEFCCFDDVRGASKKLAVYSDKPEDANARIILQYYDSAGNWVRSVFGTEWIDGESIVLPAAGGYAYSTYQVMPAGFIRAIKPKTNGTIRIFEYDTLTTTTRPLAFYEPDETVPVYRRYVLPCVGTTLSSDSTACQARTLVVAGKIRFIPVASDNDFLPISHKDAIVMAVQSCRKQDNDLIAEASLYMYGGIEPVSKQRINGAIPLLNKQLEHHRGHGAVSPVRFVTNNIWGPSIPILQ